MNGTHQALRPIDDGGLRHESHVPVSNDVSAALEAGTSDASVDKVNSKDETQVCAKSKSSPHPDPLSGRVIGGRFEVREALGLGGLGRLLSAYDRRAERALSLRVVGCAEVASLLGSRVAEVAGLAHPGLLPVIGVLRSPAPASGATTNADEGSAMIVQGALEGRSVASQLEANLLRGEPTQPEHAYRIIAGVAEALAAVHESGPHGAVGPETVWVDDQGKAVLTDLVLSRVVLGQDCREGEGQVARKALFLAPEVKRGSTPERASDVYGLSAIFYALITGRLPEEHAVVPSSLRAELTQAFDAVLKRGLAVQPSERYPSPDALCAELLESVRNAEQQARNATAREVPADLPTPEAKAPPPVSATVEPPFKPSTPRPKGSREKFSVALLVNVPTNRTSPPEEQSELPLPVAENSQVETAQPAPSTPKVSTVTTKPEVTRPARRKVERPAGAPAKRAPATPAPSPATRDGISAKLALVKAKAQVDWVTGPLPVARPISAVPAARVAADHPAQKRGVAARAPSVSVPPPAPVSSVLETPAKPAVAEPATAHVEAPAAAHVEAPAAAHVEAPAAAHVEAPAAAHVEPHVEAPAAARVEAPAAVDPRSLAAMDTLLIPVASVATERPRMPSSWTWVTPLVTRDTLSWLPSQAAVRDALEASRRALVSAWTHLTRWGAELAAAQTWRRINQPTLLLLGSSLTFALSLVALLLARGPAAHGAALLRARAEVSAVERHFDPSAAERSLAEQARAQGRVALVVEVPVYAKRRRPTTQTQTLSVAPLSEVKLETLAQMESLALPGSKVTVYAPDTEALASSLDFRLRRRAALEAITLEQVELVWADVSEKDAELESLVPSLYERSVEANRALSGSRKTVNRLSASRPKRVQTRGFFTQAAPPKRRPAFAQAGRQLRERRKAKQEARASYEEAAQRAEGYVVRPAATKGPATVAAARVTVSFGPEKETLDVPVRVHPVEVSIAPPVGVGFGATHAAGVWDTVKDKTPKAAVVLLGSQIPWQTNALGLLAAIPCLFFCLTSVLAFRMIRLETRSAWASRLHNAASAAYETLRTLTSHLRKR